MNEVEKIGTVELLKVKTTGRRLYVNLDRLTVDAYGIEKGDTLRVKIVERIRPVNRGS